MSKPKTDPSGSHAGHVTARFKCPAGHDVGAAVLLSDGVVRHIAGAEWIDAPDGGKLRMTCKRCAKAGRRLDLQANLGRVVEALADAEADADTQTKTFHIDGRAR